MIWPPLCRSALASLIADDVRVRRQRADGVGLDRDHRARRDVVEQHRQLGRVGDGGEMCDQPALRRLRVVRRDHQQTVRTFGRAGLGQPDAVCGVVGARAGDDAGPVAHRLEHGAQQLELLVVGGGRRLAGGSGDDQAVAAGVYQVVRQSRRGGGVKRAIGGERRHHRGQQGSQTRGGVESDGTHGLRLPGGAKPHWSPPRRLRLRWLTDWSRPRSHRPGWRSRSRRTPRVRRRRAGADTRWPAAGFPRRRARWHAWR